MRPASEFVRIIDPPARLQEPFVELTKPIPVRWLRLYFGGFPSLMPDIRARLRLQRRLRSAAAGRVVCLPK